MKTSNVLASFLLSSLAAAAPMQKRDLLTKTQLVVETVVVYTTVYDDFVPSATAVAVTSDAALFYEQPKPSTPVEEVKPTLTPEAPSQEYTPPAPPAPTSTSSSTTSSTPTPTPTPASSYVAPYVPPVVSEPVKEPEKQPETTQAPPPPAATTVQPAPVQSSAAPVAPVYSAPPSKAVGNGASYSGDLTVYDTQNGYGACGTQLHDTDRVVALGHGMFGATVTDVMTGNTLNEWCNKKIKITLNGKTAEGTIMDKCPGCAGNADIDVSRQIWADLGINEDTRFHNVEWSLA
ncbi:hypothetical protein GQ43DRAFT_441530 [Delitschia confertaspora ATCC 74209]|uniref:Uncharacterized protein n=1 Tax=Delitschia confertaspora ATCC 74209 TaxID=1513339 RepID=A0A9P4JLJ7_9PLEO|nr:hypothetical protein GQ43DRAFT_441530 [Delitschia confertaspora ATCC 74209]